MKYIITIIIYKNSNSGPMNVWNVYGIKLNAWDLTLMRWILIAIENFICILLVCRENRKWDSLSHDCNSFSMVAQTNNNFIPAQTSSGLTRSASCVKSWLLRQNNDVIGTRQTRR